MIGFENIIIVFLVILILLFCFASLKKIFLFREGMINISPINKDFKWSRGHNCKFKMTKTYLDILKEYSIKETKGNDWILYFPCTYNSDINNEISKLQPTSPDQKIFIINNSDEIAGKNSLWLNLVKKYGRDKAKLLSPTSYILYDLDDMNLFQKEFDPTKLYIMKRNIQRQQGLKITNDKNEISKGFFSNYIIVQELLQNPFIVNDRKINMRFYVLIICQNKEMNVYVFDDGFMYYTKMPFIKKSLEDGPNITTGYIERWIYHVNPLTHNDFKTYLDDDDRSKTKPELDIINHGSKLSNIVFDRIRDLLIQVFKSFDQVVCVGSQLDKFVTFQLFGVDIAIDDHLNPMVIECNKGPNIEAHDQHDGELKHKVIRDILKILKLIPDEDNGYIRII